ncbi:GH92 family glycosyl hydrolase [Pedobacter frigiditerrae]|uniref:GH92 family glycosyl hydrolase n=1 Tax=Pedobacter frigiditerrae TaxID=2530452 RepID=UPI00292E4A16|nr:GH92 family glycosyl hydrolase [Pedobacter frigiditerrae]
MIQLKSINLRFQPFILLFFLLAITISSNVFAQNKTIWEIGKADNQTAGLALAPTDYKKFLEHDFGWEDRYYLVGYSNPAKDFPYVLPGPKDGWGGTAPTAGIRSHLLNILFDLKNASTNKPFKLVIDLIGYNGEKSPLFKININGKGTVQQLPKGDKSNVVAGDMAAAKEYVIEIPIKAGALHNGGNEIQLTSLDGSWLVFDQVRLEGSAETIVKSPKAVYARSIEAANYEIIENGKRLQPLLVDVEHLSGKPNLTVKLDGKQVFQEKIETGRYQFEVPMSAVAIPKKSKYEVLANGIVIESGTISRSPKPIGSFASYVDTRIGTAHSRWMIGPGPWMPFSMVKLSPDNQNAGWQAGYDPTFESIGAFSHIHEWTMGGLGMLPVNGPLKIKVGDQRSAPGEGYRSRIDKSTEQAPLGSYRVDLIDYGIKAEVTATSRASFMKYTYPKATDSRIMIDLQTPAENKYNLAEVTLKKVSDYRIEGYSKQFAPQVWIAQAGSSEQEYIVHFVIEFDQPIKKFGTWIDDQIGTENLITIKDPKDAGAFVEFDTRQNQVVQMRTGISYVSVEGAAKNLTTEISNPFGWSFEKVKNNQLAVWNELLSRVKTTSNDRREKVRFYTNMYRAICSRNTFSDVDGKWVDATEKIQQFKNPNDIALGCDAFWNTFWNLNQFWNLVTPEWSSRWVKSQLAMYDANGWLAKGPAGMEYIPVMVAEHEVPLIVSAYQMGIRDYDVNKAFAAADKTLSTPQTKVGGALAGNQDFEAYMKYHYVPYDKGRFSNSLEYAYDDWTLAQLAKSIGKTAKYNEYTERANWWKNAIDTVTGYARMRKSDGSWLPDFDPFQSGRNEHYVEGNAWQLTFFVPQDVNGLAKMIGPDRFKERLSWGFKESVKWRFNAPNDQYWDYPVTQGNQQSMHFAFLFNWVKQPWLTQEWSRSIVDRYYGYGVANAYLGDEDQGQMSSWYIMAALGLFQIDGGTRANPIYEIGSPIFKNVTINLGEKYGRGKNFQIEAVNASRVNKYVQSATLNGKPLNNFWFRSSELLKGGKLILQMGPKPNTAWGIASLPAD